MSACNFTTQISGTQCIGDSLQVINTNFANLDTAVCAVSSNYVSKIVAGSNIQISPAGGTGVVSVSAYGLGIPRAWVVFNGYTPESGTDPNLVYQIYSSYNVSSVVEPPTQAEVNRLPSDPLRLPSATDFPNYACVKISFTNPIAPLGPFHMVTVHDNRLSFVSEAYANWHSPNFIILGNYGGGAYTPYSP